MALGLLGKKVGMTRIFDENGVSHAVTVVQAGPCPVIAVRDQDSNGYSAVQLAYSQVEPRRLTKPMQGVFQVAGTDAHRHLVEFRCEGLNELPAQGDVLSVDIFTEGEKVDIRGKSKGRGFSGVMKRHNFSGGRDAHGSNFHRAPGSIGTAATPSRVRKGQKMPGQYGNKFGTVKNVTVIGMIPEDHLLLLKGGVPGAMGSLLRIEKH